MKITQLTAENVKRLKAVTITPDGSIVQVTGRNGQGKSSVLDSIAYALGGKDAICTIPVRAGEKKAKVICQLDDLVVTRTFTAEGGGTLTVANADGARYPSPQAVLDKLVGKLTLDPLEFVRIAPKQQSEMLRKLVGLDFTELDQKRQEAYSSRTVVNRSAAEAEARLAAMPKVDAPVKEIVVTDLIAERDGRMAENTKADQQRKRIVALETNIANTEAICDDSIRRQSEVDKEYDAACARIDAELAAELERVRERFRREREEESRRKDIAIARERENIKRASKNKADAETELKSVKAAVLPEPLDVDAITHQIADAEATNRNVRDNERLAQQAELAKALRDEADSYSKRITEIDDAKAKALAEAKFPVPGLSFNESGVLLRNLPFEQASSAEQLRASVAIGLAMNPKLRVLLIRDGSLLDAGGLAALSEMAELMDAQVWIERVDDSGSVGVVIEDGCVAEAVMA